VGTRASLNGLRKRKVQGQLAHKGCSLTKTVIQILSLSPNFLEDCTAAAIMDKPSLENSLVPAVNQNPDRPARSLVAIQSTLYWLPHK
jgi:hypothetical protein